MEVNAVIYENGPETFGAIIYLPDAHLDEP